MALKVGGIGRLLSEYYTKTSMVLQTPFCPWPETIAPRPKLIFLVVAFAICRNITHRKEKLDTWHLETVSRLFVRTARGIKGVLEMAYC
jgi:hypothetical protein